MSQLFASGGQSIGASAKDATRKLIELISEFSRIAGYKVNTQKSNGFLETNNERSEREINEIIPFAIATKRTKCLEINLSEETKVLYSENYKRLVKNKKMLMKQIKDDTNRWKDIFCS